VRFAPAGFLRRDAQGRARRLPRSLRQRCRFLPRGLQALGLCALVLALAWPQERVPLPLQREGLDVLLCIDVSSSMVADDLERGRSRLEVTRRAAHEFIAQRPDDRIGLVTFARYPDLVCPPTVDHGSLRAMLDAIGQVAADGEEDATGIGMAVARCAVALRASTASSKVVVLLTDGEENVARADLPQEITPLEAAKLCAELGVRVYTIAAGIGRQTPAGQWVELDTGPVRQLAERTGGAFFAARDASAVARGYAMIGELERSAFAAPRFEYADRFVAFLVAGLLLWALGRLAGATVWGGLP
jgi:Ca-activated chloride channel family protein